MKKFGLTKTTEGFDVKESVLWYILLPLLLSIFISFMLILQIRLLLTSADEVVKNQTVISQINVIQKLVLDMETGLRGYFINGNKVFLQPYNEAIKKIPHEMEVLNSAIVSVRGDANPKEDLTPLIQVWLDYSKARIEQRKRSRWMPADKYSDGGRQLMEQIRERFESMIAEQTLSMEERKKNVESNTRLSVALTVILSVLLSILLSFTLYKRIRSLGAYFTAILNELTQAQKKLEDANDHLEKTVEERTVSLKASNTELEAFCYSVSHDLRAPLRGIDGFSLALVEDYGNKIDDNGKKYLNYIRQGVQRMGQLIDDLLNLSRITRLDLRKDQVNLTELFHVVSQDLIKNKPDENPNSPFQFECEKNLVAYGDKGLLRIVLENLLSNAWKFTREKPQPQVKMGSRTLPDGKKVFFIQDNGVGFDMAFKDKLFNAFQRLHSASEYAGTGIGLATVKRVILKHGGDVWVESALGQGTTFFFTLPEGN